MDTIYQYISRWQKYADIHGKDGHQWQDGWYSQTPGEKEEKFGEGTLA